MRVIFGCEEAIGTNHTPTATPTLKTQPRESLFDSTQRTSGSGDHSMCCSCGRCANSPFRFPDIAPPYNRLAAQSFGILLYMLTKRIRNDMTAAMKARDQLRVDTLRGALAAFTNELVAKGRKPTEELADNDTI